MNHSNRKKVVIIGAGFGGLNAAKQLGNKDDVDVILIDKNNYHLFQPLLYQVATATLNPAEIAYPIRAAVKKYGNVQVLFDEVQTIDLANKLVKGKDTQYPYDYLILACGSTNSYFGHPEWEKFAPGLKSIEEASYIKNKIFTAFENAEKDPENAQKYLNFVVVGGGPTGVELAGAIAEISKNTLKNQFRRFDPSIAKVYLVEMKDRVLLAFNSQLSEKAQKDLEKMGVILKLNTSVENINDEGVFLKNEMIPTTNVIWAAGVKAAPLNQKLGIELDRAGRIMVDPFLNIPSHPEVFVVGDQACAVYNNSPLPGVAPVAIQQGVHTAKNILRLMQNKAIKPFSYFNKGQMATIGRNKAVVEFKQLKITGRFAWIMWLFIHVLYLVGFHNKFIVFFQWIWSYITDARDARIITKDDKKYI